MSSFFSMVLRMKYIDRWGLMRNTHRESLAAHTLDVAVLTHALATIGNVRLGKGLNADHAAMLAVYHDASEIITGDMPTPIKYHDPQITNAYKQVEAAANMSLFAMLPNDLGEVYKDFFYSSDEDEYLWRLVKAADKLSALIKCVEEEKSGNTEFSNAYKTTLQSIELLDIEELNIFMNEFFDSFTKTLDEQ